MFYSIGYNYYEVNKKHDTIHAEVDCVMNLKSWKKNKPKKIYLFVFRTNSKGNKLMMSKPCANCIKYIQENLVKKNYKLKSLYYCNWEGEITKMN